jgi:hypothetical protein
MVRNLRVSLEDIRGLFGIPHMRSEDIRGLFGTLRMSSEEIRELFGILSACSEDIRLTREWSDPTCQNLP